jgi:8-oxo-dGTP pyrophosphatase MutT (NUDIX family)
MDRILTSLDSIRDRGLTQSLRQEGWPLSERMIVAAVCYRRDANGDVEFLLVRTRNGRWTFPKGGVDGDPTEAGAAAREAHEEAGVRGEIEPQAFTWYLHCKFGSDVHPVNAHLCRVVHLETPHEPFRTPQWFSAERAKRRLREDRPSFYAGELERVVDRAVRRIQVGTRRTNTSLLN